jgi:hypothetical protein
MAERLLIPQNEACKPLGVSELPLPLLRLFGFRASKR